MGKTTASKKSRWRFAGKLLVSLGLLGLVAYFVDFQELPGILVNLNPWYFVAALALIYLNEALLTYKWNQLLRIAKVEVPFFLLFRTYLISPMVGILLPSSIGSDLFRVYYLSRHNVDATVVLAAVIAERVIGLMVIILLTLATVGLALYLMGDSLTYFRAVGLALLVSIVLVVVIVGIALRSFKLIVLRLSKHFNLDSFIEKLRQVITLCSDYRNHFGTITVVSVWTLVAQIGVILWTFLLARALHIDVSLLELIAILPLLLLAARLPISFNGIGVVEGLAVAMFGLVGVSSGETLLLTILSRIMWILSGLPWAIHHLFKGPQVPKVPITTQDTLRV